jgi:hypothetical protein
VNHKIKGLEPLTNKSNKAEFNIQIAQYLEPTYQTLQTAKELQASIETVNFDPQDPWLPQESP